VGVWIDPSQLLFVLNAGADAFGYSEMGIPVPAGTTGAQVYAQFLWLSACGPQGFSASNGLSMQIQ